MRAFRFRARAALDLRRREHEAALRALADAQARARAAHGALDDAAQRVARAQQEGARALAQTTSVATLSWHRSWMTRLEHDQRACADAVTAREADVARAAAECERTRTRVRALERALANAQEAWRRAALAEEQKEMDALATMRFSSQNGPQGGGRAAGRTAAGPDAGTRDQRVT